MTKNFLNTFSAVEMIINAFVRTIVNIFTFAITEIAPMVAPLPPAFSIYRAMTERLHTPAYVAIIAAIAIEIIGMFSSKVSIRCYQWNAGRLKSEAAIPQGLSIAMTSIFFLVVLVLALTVELLPGLTALVIPGFVMISISVYVNLAIHTNLEKLESNKAAMVEARQEKNGINAEIRVAKNELSDLTAKVEKLRFERDQLARVIDTHKAEIKHVTPIQAQTKAEKMKLLKLANDTRKLTKEARQEKVAALAQDHSQAEIAALLGVSVATIKRDYKQLNGSINKGVSS